MSDGSIVRREIRNFDGQKVWLDLHVTLACPDDVNLVDGFIALASRELARIEPPFLCPHICSGRDSRLNLSPFLESVPVAVLIASVLMGVPIPWTARPCFSSCADEAICWQSGCVSRRFFEPEVI
jgi:hypothetical protein